MSLGQPSELIAIATGAALAAAAVTFAVLNARRQRRPNRHGAKDSSTASAAIDTATRVMTRTDFDAVLQDGLRSGDKAGADSCVLHVSVDGLQSVSDNLGPEVAEQSLGIVAARLRDLCGDSTPLARLAKNEFAMWLNAPRAAGEQLALRITETCTTALSVRGQPVELGVSVGVAFAPEHGTGAQLVSKAAAATRAVQRSGGGAHAVFDPLIEAAATEENMIARELKDALLKKQLELFYQPKIDARKIEVTAVEALLRWRHPVMGLVSPARFIPVAERHGLIDMLGQWVLESALRQAAAWRAIGLPMRVAINVSGVQFRQDEFVPKLERSLKASGVPARSLTLEVNEIVALEGTSATRRTFARLNKLGVQIAVGEFTGHDAALTALAGLPVHEIKLARTLVAALASDGEERRVTERVVAAAHARGMRVVAEGIETEAQRDQAVHLGCDELQGFMFARPMSARAVGLWAVDASRNLVQTFRSEQFKDTQIGDDRHPQASAFAQTQISLRR